MSKLGVVVFLLLTLLLYGFLVLRSEFIYSVSFSSEGHKADRQKLGCSPFKASPNEPNYFKYEGKAYSNRSPLLLDRNRVYGEYLDFLVQHPECLATSVLANIRDGRNLTYIYYDRSSDTPVVKVTIESLE